MKLLLIGPYPPPHGGISVHVAEAKRQLDEAGVRCVVLNLDRNASESDQYICFRSSLELLPLLIRYARDGWTLHLHINGHNAKSWVIALLCGAAGRLAPARLLTLHSGMAPAYLTTGGIWRRYAAWLACLLYDRVIVVNRQIRDVIASLGVSMDSLEELPAYLPAPSSPALPAAVVELLRQSQPLITTVLFFRPEYGFDLLVQALARLRRRYRNLRCLVMGSGEQETEARELVRREGLEDIVILAGDVPHELCLSYIALSDLFVRTTLKDGDSISVREALSLGVPAVVSDVGARPPGALLFQAGNLEDLIAKMDATLAAMPRRKRQESAALPASGERHRLLDIYRRIAVSG
jgi:glycogen(starch) synthase